MAEGQPVPRLTKAQFKFTGPAFPHRGNVLHTPGARLLRWHVQIPQERSGVKALIAGTSDHNHYKGGYPAPTSTAKCDIIDGHVYWQHPNYVADPKGKRQDFTIGNTPMVDDPANSMVVQLSHTPITGKPYTVSEINHPFPNKYACGRFWDSRRLCGVRGPGWRVSLYLEHRSRADGPRRCPATSRSVPTA